MDFFPIDGQKNLKTVVQGQRTRAILGNFDWSSLIRDYYRNGFN